MSDSTEPNINDSDEAPRDFLVSNEDFDFDDLAVTEREYYNLIDHLHAQEFTHAVSHSLCLNEIRVAIDPGYTGHIDSGILPAGVAIRNVGQWKTDEEDCRLWLELSTTRYFCTPEGEDELFPGEYDNEAMAALAAELDLFSEVTDISNETTDGELRVDATVSGVESTYLFNDVMTFLGYDIRDVWIDRNTIERLRFGYYGSRVWSREAFEQFQSSKLSSYRSECLDESGSVELPCGHEVEPTIEMVGNLYTKRLAAFDTVLIEGMACHVVPVDDPEDAFLEPTEWPDDVSPDTTDEDDYIATAISRGYICTDCGVFYPFVDSDAEGRERSSSDTEREVLTTINTDEIEYVFSHAPIAARPIGHRESWLDD